MVEQKHATVDSKVVERVLNGIKVRVDLIDLALQEGHLETATTQVALLTGFIAGAREGLKLWDNGTCPAK